jgi:hypothetical protein
MRRSHSIAAILNENEIPLSSQETNSVVDHVPGYLGNTSFSEVWNTPGHASDTVWLGSQTSFRKMLRTPRTYQLSMERIQSGAQVLRSLAEAHAVKRIIEQVGNPYRIRNTSSS